MADWRGQHSTVKQELSATFNSTKFYVFIFILKGKTRRSRNCTDYVQTAFRAVAVQLSILELNEYTVSTVV